MIRRDDSDGRARKAIAIKLSDEERDVLERLVRRRKVARSEAQRAEIVLRAADGLNNCEIAEAVDATRQTVRTWRKRFAEEGFTNEHSRCARPKRRSSRLLERSGGTTMDRAARDAGCCFGSSVGGPIRASPGRRGKPGNRRRLRLRRNDDRASEASRA